MNELVRSSTRFYRNFRKEDVRVSLVHAREVILPEVARSLGEFARKKMEKAGIDVILNARAVAATHEGVELNDGRVLRGGTIVCTIGTAPASLVQNLQVAKEHGRIRTAPDMRIEGHANAWALGDCALIINAFDNQPSPTTAQFAERQGRQAALNLVRVIRGEATQPFRFKALGQLCSIGGYEAVAEIFGMCISGFWAWFLWRAVYLFKLPTWSRRIKVGLDWAWDVLFPRDLSFLNTDTAQQLTHAYYRPGDLIQRQGDPARFFSVIDEGEVEVLRTSDENPEGKVLGVLGKGDFFGDAALAGNRPHYTTIRARTPVRLRQLGSALFSEVASTFLPLRELLAKAALRRSKDFWARAPLEKSVLENELLASLVEPLPAKLLRKDVTLPEAIKALSESPTGQLLIVDEKQRLWGTFERDDMDQVLAQIAEISQDQRAGLPRRRLSDFIPANSLCVSLDDSPLTASMTLMDHGKAWLPVVRTKDDFQPVGYVRGERIVNRIIEKLANRPTDQSSVAKAG